MIYNKDFNAEKNGFKIDGVVCIDNQGLLDFVPEIRELRKNKL